MPPPSSRPEHHLPDHAYGLRQRRRLSVLVVAQTIGLPAEVTPVAPATEQNAPAVTTGRLGLDTVVLQSSQERLVSFSYLFLNAGLAGQEPLLAKYVEACVEYLHQELAVGPLALGILKFDRRYQRFDSPGRKRRFALEGKP